MILKECIMTNSTCYKDQLKEGYFHWSKHKDKVGIVVHSTGANNPNIKRYVQPSDDDPNYDEIIADIGKNKSKIDWNHKYREAGVHAFIGLNAKKEVETYQVLPYEWGAWGVGKGSKGSYNFAPRAHIQFEICEDNLKDEKYFNAVFKEAIEYCAYLCEKFGWDSSVICSHAESHARGYGGNHADCDHWLKKYGKNMNWFRAEVQKLLDADGQSPSVKTEIVYVEYIVQSGDNIYKIAKKHNVTTEAIIDANNLVNPSLIYPGDALKIPVEKVVEQDTKPKEPATPEVKEVVYTIQKGDSLSKIAQKFGTTYQEIAAYNKIKNPSRIYVGQKIKIPNAKEVVRKTHIVVAGDTLSEIAFKYGSSVSVIVEANKGTYPSITPSHIIVGWILQIPVQGK